MRRGYLTPPVMIILALITLGVALTLYFNTNLLKNIKNKSTPSSEPSVQDQPSPISDAGREPNDSAETANWKTYTNTQLGFSIKYPSSWFVYDNETPPCDKGIRGYLFVNKTALADCFFGDVLPADFYVYVQPIPEDPDYGPLPKSTKYDTFTSFEVAGEKGVVNITTEKSEGPRRKEARVYVNHNSNQYMISYPNLDFQGNHEQVFDQILSTFKFLD